MSESIANQEQEDVFVNVEVPRALWSESKALAALHNKTIKQYLAEALIEFNQQNKKPW